MYSGFSLLFSLFRKISIIWFIPKNIYYLVYSENQLLVLYQISTCTDDTKVRNATAEYSFRNIKFVTILWCNGEIPTIGRTSPLRNCRGNFWYAMLLRVPSTLSRYGDTLRDYVASLYLPLCFAERAPPAPWILRTSRSYARHSKLFVPQRREIRT